MGHPSRPPTGFVSPFHYQITIELHRTPPGSNLRAGLIAYSSICDPTILLAISFLVVLFQETLNVNR